MPSSHSIPLALPLDPYCTALEGRLERQGGERGILGGAGTWFQGEATGLCLKPPDRRTVSNRGQPHSDQDIVGDWNWEHIGGGGPFLVAQGAAHAIGSVSQST